MTLRSELAPLKEEASGGGGGGDDAADRAVVQGRSIRANVGVELKGVSWS